MKKRKTKKSPYDEDGELTNEGREKIINNRLMMMKHKDLVVSCVSRGAPFEELIHWDHHKLASFFRNNFEKTEEPTLLDLYDIWREEYLKNKGYSDGDGMLHPNLRLGFTGDLERIEGPITSEPSIKKKIPIVMEEKKAREKDTKTGVVSGTKKNLTYQLALSGENLEVIIKKVKEQFPGAQDKSIKIWVKRAKSNAKEDKDTDD